jgi:DNA-binding NtrC family response regulator
MSRILVVEDDTDLRESLRRSFALPGYEVVASGSGIQARRILASSSVRVLVADVVTADQDGLGLIRSVRKLQPSVKVIAFSGAGAHAAEFDLAVAKRLGVDAIFTRPLPLPKIQETIRRLIGN